MGLVHAHEDQDARCGGERCDGPDGDADVEGVGKDAGEEGTDGEASVSPEPVDADRPGTPGRVGDVADGCEQGRVHHRGAGAEQHCGGRPDGEAFGRGEHAERGGLKEHAADDERLAADAVGEAAGDELPEAPHCGVEGCEDADAGHRQSGGGEVQRKQPPGEAVVEVVDQPGLGRRGQRLLLNEVSRKISPVLRSPWR